MQNGVADALPVDLHTDDTKIALLRMRSALSRFNALDITTGAHREGSPTAPVAGSRTFPDSDFPNNATTFVAIKQLQRPGGNRACNVFL